MHEKANSSSIRLRVFLILLVTTIPLVHPHAEGKWGLAWLVGAGVAIGLVSYPIAFLWIRLRPSKKTTRRQ
jgi:hypothetical protein